MLTWRALTALVVRLPSALDAQLRRDAGISHFDYAVMAWLSESEGRSLPMSELAHLAEGSLSRLSHCVKRLESRGWIIRAPDPNDRRTTIATLTAAGMKKVAAAAPGHVAAVRRHVFDPLTDRQIAELRVIADRVAETVEPDGGNAAS